MQQLQNAGQLAGTALMVVAPVGPYALQAVEMQKANSSEGFSAMICLILLVANILRIAFWFGKAFDISLLWQAVLMIGCQGVMLYLWHRLRSPAGLFRQESSLSFGSYFAKFWDWEDFSAYVATIAGFVGLVAGSTWLFKGYSVYVEAIGFLSLSTEACLGVPQVISNFQRKSTAGLSMGMIGGWFLGDASKTIFFLMVGAPFQFLMCGIVQLAVDCVIVFQIVSYK